MNNDLFEKTLLEECHSLRYPHQIDVVEAVMEQVLHQPVPLATNTDNKKIFLRHLYSGGSVAACLALSVGIALHLTAPRLDSEQQIDLLISDVSSYIHSYAAANEHYVAQFASIEQIFLDEYNNEQE